MSMKATIKFKTKINIQRLRKEKVTIEKELGDAISRLDNYGGECHCGSFNFETVEDVAYCVECGGFKP